MKHLDDWGVTDLITELPGPDVTQVIFPSSLIRMFDRYYSHELRRRVGADPRELEPFWQAFFSSQRRREWADTHPFLAGATADWSHTVPITVHEDAGPCSKTKSACCLSWSGLPSRGDERVTKYLMCSHIKGTNHTSDAWPAIIDDLETLARGIDLQSGRWRFVVLFAKADEETHVLGWGLPSYNDPGELCTECLADRCFRPFTDLSISARWRATARLPLVSYMQRFREPRHPLAASKFCTRYLMYLDIMHVADCKGVAACIYGGVLSHLLELRTLGANRDARLQTINAAMRSWYEEHPGTHRLPVLKLTNVISDGFSYSYKRPGGFHVSAL